jgi:hypothetical protein
MLVGGQLRATEEKKKRIIIRKRNNIEVARKEPATAVPKGGNVYT